MLVYPYISWNILGTELGDSQASASQVLLQIQVSINRQGTKHCASSSCDYPSQFDPSLLRNKLNKFLLLGGFL